MPTQIEDFPEDSDFVPKDKGSVLVDKLNMVKAKGSEQIAGFNEMLQAGEDAATILTQVQALLQQVQDTRDETSAIATGSLNWQDRTSDTSVATGQKLILKTPGIQALLDQFEANIAVGQWFELENATTANCYLVSTAGLTLEGEIGSVSGGDRLIIPSRKTVRVTALSLTKLRVR